MSTRSVERVRTERCGIIRTMTIVETLFRYFLISLPVVTIAVAGRLAVSMVRSIRLKRRTFALYAALAIIVMAAFFAAVGTAWFAYGVSHGSKDMATDLTLAAISVVLIYGGGFGLWFLARRLDGKIQIIPHDR